MGFKTRRYMTISSHNSVLTLYIYLFKTFPLFSLVFMNRKLKENSEFSAIIIADEY